MITRKRCALCNHEDREQLEHDLESIAISPDELDNRMNWPSGTSSRHIQALSEQVLEMLKDNGIKNSKIEGIDSSEWKLVDGIDIIVHIFHPEKRKFYELEKIWSELIPKEKLII